MIFKNKIKDITFVKVTVFNLTISYQLYNLSKLIHSHKFSHRTKIEPRPFQIGNKNVENGSSTGENEEI